MTKFVITIDGPGGCGKSTVARLLADRLGFTYVDTGAMYRAVTLQVMRANISFEDEERIVQIAKRTPITFKKQDNSVRVFIDSEDITEPIRTPELTSNVKHIAKITRVREVLVNKQKDMAQDGGVVMEGRDIGTVVAPNARFKFFLEADFKERVSRRYKELKTDNPSIDIKDVEKELAERDKSDYLRKTGPLKLAEDALKIDTTHMTIEEVVDYIEDYVMEKYSDKKNLWSA
jgi:cytidylate kinase